MPFVKIPGFDGNVYCPATGTEAPKKHDCRGCFSCQMCSDDRCLVCRAEFPCKHKKEDVSK